jgi:hypothetical protein
VRAVEGEPDVAAGAPDLDADPFRGPATTTPAKSRPGTLGRIVQSIAPATFFTSDGLTEAAFTAITAQSLAATGSGTSATSSTWGLPNRSKRNARTGDLLLSIRSLLISCRFVRAPPMLLSTGDLGQRIFKMIDISFCDKGGVRQLEHYQAGSVSCCGP